MSADEDELDDDDEALAREAEEAANAYDDEDDGELATPLPGFAYDPIIGVGGVGAFEGRPEAPRLVGRWPGDVLLEVRGRRVGSGTLALTAVGFLVFVTFSCLALAGGTDLGRRLPWPGRPSLGVSWLVWVAGATAFAVGLALQLIARGIVVVFTSEGIGRSGKGGDAFVPWSAVHGYRRVDDMVLVEGETGQLVVPAADEERAGEVMALLEARGVPRL